MDWLRKTPIVSLLLALAMVAAPFLLSTEPGPSAEEFAETREEARSYLTRNPRLEVDSVTELILDPAWLAELRAAAATEEGRLEVELPARLMARSQARLDELIDSAYGARLKSDPAWRLGVLDANTPAQNYFAHVVVNGSMAGIALCLVVFLIAGAPLERSWGSAIFGTFAVTSTLAAAFAYRFLDASGGVPWYGGAGVAGAIAGAYFIRGLGGHFIVPGWIVLPAWLGAETFLVRSFWIDDIGAVPWATLFGAVGLGALVGGALRALNVESARLDRADARRAKGPNPVVIRAARMRSDGDPYQALDLIQAAWREDPADLDVCETFFSIAEEVGQPEVAAKAIVPSLEAALKKGDLSRALEYWLPLASKECEVDLGPTGYVRLGEGLLDAGHPQEALFSLRAALAGGVSSSHATRIVHIARDLDEGLAREAAAIALTDPGLDPKSRQELGQMAETPISEEPLEAEEETSSSPSRSQLDRRVQAEHQTIETTAFPAALDLDLEGDDLLDSELEGDLADFEAGESIASDVSLHLDGLPEDSLHSEAEGEAVPVGDSGDVLSHWNDPTALDPNVLESGTEDSALGESAHLDDLDVIGEEFELGLSAGAPDLMDSRDDDTNSDLTPIMDSTDEVTTPMSASCGKALLSSDTETGIFDQATSMVPLRSLKALEAVPVESSDAALEIDVDVRGKSKLPYARIQAISIAAVSGLGPKPVLVLDFVLNWKGDSEEAMKSIRLRSDRFDPLAFAQGSNPLDALTNWISDLEHVSGAICLPNRDVLLGEYARYASVADYEREVLLAVAESN